MKFRFLTVLVALTMVFGLSYLATAQTSNLERDTEIDPKEGYLEAKFANAPPVFQAKALVVILRPYEDGKDIPVAVRVNNEHVGQTLGQTYIYTYVEPGETMVHAAYDQKAGAEFIAYGGRVYYITQKVEYQPEDIKTRLFMTREQPAIEHIDERGVTLVQNTDYFVKPMVDDETVGHQSEAAPGKKDTPVDAREQTASDEVTQETLDETEEQTDADQTEQRLEDKKDADELLDELLR